VTPPKSGPSRRERVDQGLERLAAAVLIQALEDLTRGPRRYRQDALDWLLGKTSGGFSFELCCDLLGRDPKDVLYRVQRFFVRSERGFPALRRPRPASPGDPAPHSGPTPAYGEPPACFYA